MSNTPTSSTTTNLLPLGFDDGGMDWAAFDTLTDEHVVAAASADSDAQQQSKARMAAARRTGLAGVIRFQLGLTHTEFEARDHVPADVLLAWEIGQAKPDSAMQAYLILIADDPKAVAERLAESRTPVAAE
jgi:DNA-binding transcriptional regulator YiaG